MKKLTRSALSASAVFVCAGLAALTVAGCGKSAHETNEPADAGTMSALGLSDASAATGMPSAIAEPSAAASATAPDEPPTERRAERKAAAEITHANYKTEYAKLQKELGTP